MSINTYFTPRRTFGIMHLLFLLRTHFKPNVNTSFYDARKGAGFFVAVSYVFIQPYFIIFVIL